MKIEQYDLVYAPNQNELKTLINKMIQNGWQPFGSPVIVVTPDYSEQYDEEISYYQAVVKYSHN